MKITQLIRKHASLLALLACLAAVVAAPYLIPENPDSQTFRNGSFGALLLFACYFPLQQAFSKANLRTLICAAGFGLLLSFALSLGAELRLRWSASRNGQHDTPFCRAVSGYALAWRPCSTRHDHAAELSRS